jgi:hypothetical protein
MDEQVPCRIAKTTGEARREWVVDIAVDPINCGAVGNAPALSTSNHPDHRNGDEANERENGSLPGDMHAHGASSRFRRVQTRPERLDLFVDAPIMARGRNMVCDLRHQG